MSFMARGGASDYSIRKRPGFPCKYRCAGGLTWVRRAAYHWLFLDRRTSYWSRPFMRTWRRPLALASFLLAFTASTLLAQSKEPQPRKLSNDEKKDLQAISTMLNGSGA